MTISSVTLAIRPIDHLLNAVVRVPGSKSMTARALILAALADGKTRITNALFSDDTRYMAAALQALGFAIELDETRDEMLVSGSNGIIPAKHADLFVGNSGTTARFLCALLTLGAGDYILDGKARMRERPIGDLAQALIQLGATIHPTGTAAAKINSFTCPPIRIEAAGLHGGETRLAAKTSSQFVSAILMVAPYALTPVKIELTTEPHSRPYVDLTIAMMHDFGVDVKRRGPRSFAVRTAAYRAHDEYMIEPDASAAAYFFAAAAMCGGRVRVQGLSAKSEQGDRAFVEVLKQMGCVVHQREDGIEVQGCNPLRGVDVDMGDIPDTAQTLAVLAPFADSPTRIRGIASARLKESDRVHATCTELTRLGVRVQEHSDGLTIHPVETIHAGLVRTYDDHRMAMAFALIGLRVPGIQIENPDCVAKSFPNYFEVLDALR